ncbi:MAG: transketolase [Micrococcales bacterium]|nr:transketolase [Micrococcales bacterium]
MPDRLEWSNLDNLAVATAKALAADAVEKAGSGHPGTAISLAGGVYLLYQKLMRHDPANPDWFGRDRLVVSAGHTAAMIYVQLYLAGYQVSLDDLKALRTAGSITPGHPEYGMTPGVEMSTGPLGQGLASAVGMAMAARRLGAMLEQADAAGQGENAEPAPLDQTIWVVAGEGDMQEGLSSEASSLAGTQKLGHLVVLYDENHITIEGDTALAFTEDVLARYRAYGWHTESVDWTGGGRYVEDYQGLYAALRRAQTVKDKPCIVKLTSIIGWPAPNKQNTPGIHGSKLGTAELAGLKRNLGLDPNKSFEAPPEVLSHTRQALRRGQAAAQQWDQRLAAWLEDRPEAGQLLRRLASDELPANWRGALPIFEAGQAIATRSASGKVLDALGAAIPELWGGSADLGPSNNTSMTGQTSFLPHNKEGRTIHFGIREHAMAAAANGMALFGHNRPYCGTFLVFSDYMRGAVRLSALMQLPVTYVWTHDSLGVGEDGPTHQPIEQLEALRAIPGLAIVRPACANETAQAWASIIERGKPAGLILSRQNLPVLDQSSKTLAGADNVRFGAYTLAPSPTGQTDVLLMASGSEVQLVLAAQTILAELGFGADVVSAPCLEWFYQQSQQYQDKVLPPSVRARVSVEAGTAGPWRGLVGSAGVCISVDSFGESAAGAWLLEQRSFNPQKVAEAAQQSIAKAGS